MPKRRSDECGGGERNPKASRPIRRHLYLVLDDWSSGYTIRKIDLLVYPAPAANYATGRQIITGGFLGKQRLPPAIMRVEAARGLPTHLVMASGSSKLLFMQPPIDPSSSSSKPAPLSRNFVPIADVRMRSISLGTRPTHDPVDPIYMPVVVVVGGGGGDCLFALDSRGSFGVLCPAPADPLESWSWRALPDPPFERRHVVSYASHPDGRIFVNAKENDDSDEATTFTFSMAMAGAECKTPEWNRHDIRLPFAGGRGHFDPVLNAFVGLSGAPASVGHLCLVYMDGSQKLSKEKLFGEDSLVEMQVKLFSRNRPVETQVGSTLVYMGGRSNFCLVQCISHDQTNGGIPSDKMDDSSKVDGQEVSGHSCCLFRLTAFYLKYDKNGDLTIVILQVQYFSVPEGVTQLALKNPAAFWM